MNEGMNELYLAFSAKFSRTKYKIQNTKEKEREREDISFQRERQASRVEDSR